MKKGIETNIDKLKTQRRLNVQEQIAIRRDQIHSEANYWRTHGIPNPLKLVFMEKGIDIDKSIMLDYEQDFPGISTDVGMVLTLDGNLYEFDADLNPNRTELIELYSFTQISERFEINENKKGIGKTYGYLAIEVLKELNKD